METNTQSVQITEKELKNRIEALLFSIGKSIEISSISKMIKEKNLDLIKKALESLRSDFSQNEVMVLNNERDSWHLTVREKYINYVKKIITETQFPKSLTETMAIIAWKAPVLQCSVVDIRGNKCYDHIKALEEYGFIRKNKKGNSYLLELTNKFFDYFDVSSQEELKQKLKESGIDEKDFKFDESSKENKEEQTTLIKDSENL
ncbi:MAG TPA: SMC-Scp complex subunit ScpB [Candidatus Woesearchaeota archaeon]|nr:SMC-Scp complex subunit ScpB [Candidatus Woesearchaeota archaeon]